MDGNPQMFICGLCEKEFFIYSYTCCIVKGNYILCCYGSKYDQNLFEWNHGHRLEDNGLEILKISSGQDLCDSCLEDLYLSSKIVLVHECTLTFPREKSLLPTGNFTKASNN